MPDLRTFVRATTKAEKPSSVVATNIGSVENAGDIRTKKLNKSLSARFMNQAKEAYSWVNQSATSLFTSLLRHDFFQLKINLSKNNPQKNAMSPTLNPANHTVAFEDDLFLQANYELKEKISDRFQIITEKNKDPENSSSTRSFIAVQSYHDLLNLTEEEKTKILEFARNSSDKEGVFAFVFTQAGFEEFKKWQKDIKANIQKNFILSCWVHLRKKIKSLNLPSAERKKLKEESSKKFINKVKTAFMSLHPEYSSDLENSKGVSEYLTLNPVSRTNANILHADTKALAMTAITEGRGTLYVHPNDISHKSEDSIKFGVDDIGRRIYRNFEVDPIIKRREAPAQSLSYISSWVIHQSPPLQKSDKRKGLVFGSQFGREINSGFKQREAQKYHNLFGKYNLPNSMREQGLAILMG